jgi:hydrogenase expression/formation protein HypC
MCLAIPARITELIDADRALASLGGIVREINVALVEDPRPGDWVILHVGYALSKLDEAEAVRTLESMSASDIEEALA